MRQLFWNQNFYNAAVDLNIKQRFRFCRKLCIHEITSCFVLYRNNGKFNSFCVFKRLQFEVFYFIASDTDIKELTTSKILNRKIHNISDFGRTLLQRVNLWTKLFTTCLTLKWSFWSVRDFKKKFLQGGRLRKK